MKIGDVVEVNLIGEITKIEKGEKELFYTVKSTNANDWNEVLFVKESRLTPVENR
jgi:hypothetical protein